VELSSSQPPRLLLVRTRSLGVAPKKQKKKKKKRKKKKRFYTLKRISKPWQFFPGTQAELRRVGKFSFVALIIRKTHLLFSSKAFPYFFFFFFLLSLAISALSRNQLIFLSLSCFWLMGFYLFIS
jgi:hypothetical protein